MSQILLFNDFGWQGPYLGQMHSVLAAKAPGVPVIDLQIDAPACNPQRSAPLLGALSGFGVPGSVWVCVVDPGVGGQREPLMCRAGGQWFVGPDNGLMIHALRRLEPESRSLRLWRIDRQSDALSASFHGRDLFAPVAAALARGEVVPGTERVPDDLVGWDAAQELAEVIYIDGYGNAMTGLLGEGRDRACRLVVSGVPLVHALTFSASPEGAAFWYVNSIGLVEVAVNRGRADEALELSPGAPVSFETDG